MTFATGRRVLAGRADALEEDQQSSAQRLSDPATAVYYLRRHLLVSIHTAASCIQVTFHAAFYAAFLQRCTALQAVHLQSFTSLQLLPTLIASAVDLVTVAIDLSFMYCILI